MVSMISLPMSDLITDFFYCLPLYLPHVLSKVVPLDFRKGKKVKAKTAYKETRRRLGLRPGMRVFAFPFCQCECLCKGHPCARKECRGIADLSAVELWTIPTSIVNATQHKASSFYHVSYTSLNLCMRLTL